MLYFPKIDDYLKILTYEEEFVAINFSEYFKFIREEQNLRKVAVILTAPGEIEKHVQSNSSVNCIN